MGWILWTAVIFAAWCLLSIGVGLLLGALLRRRAWGFGVTVERRPDGSAEAPPPRLRDVA